MREKNDDPFDRRPLAFSEIMRHGLLIDNSLQKVFGIQPKATGQRRKSSIIADARQGVPVDALA
jgi:hypothetical protein